MLSQFTDEQLRAELKRRANERRKLQGRKLTEYVYLKGIVEHIDNVRWHTTNGVKLKSYAHWEFKLGSFECDEQEVLRWAKIWNTFKCALTKEKSPIVGDKVIVKIRKPKVFMPSNVRMGKIVEVIKK